MSLLPGPFGLPELLAGIIAVALTAYVLMGGADFGGGVWDLLASGPRRGEQRALVSRAIGPIWEANHVWLIVAVVLVFTAFPSVYAVLGTVLHIPLTLMLVGIVLRGSAFVFRNYGSRDDRAQLRWGRVFAIASTITPLFLGVAVGAVAAGRVGAAAQRLASAQALGTAPGFAEVFVASWLAPFPLAVGVLALALFAFLAAVYLALEAPDGPLREDFRRRALWSALAVFFAAFGALGLAGTHAVRLGWGLTREPWALPLQLLTGVAALTAIGALWTRRWALARLAAAAQASLILWGWTLAQYPYLVPPTHAIRDAAAPRATLELLLAALVAGAIILVPSLVYLFRTFAEVREDAEP